MTEVIPAILAENFIELREKLNSYVNLVDLVQIDVCDGHFVSSLSWPMRVKDREGIENILNEEEGLPFWDKLDFEFDLMIQNAHQYFEFFIKLGAKRIVFHLEAVDNIQEFKEFLEGIDLYLRESIQIGIAINTTTKIDELRLVISNIDFVQCMGIENIGFQGQEFDNRVIEQITNLHKEYPEIIISVDGGVDENNAQDLIKAGAKRLVIGHALTQSFDLKESIEYFQNL